MQIFFFAFLAFFFALIVWHNQERDFLPPVVCENQTRKKVQKTLNKMVIAEHPEKFQDFFCAAHFYELINMTIY